MKTPPAKYTTVTPDSPMSSKLEKENASGLHMRICGLVSKGAATATVGRDRLTGAPVDAAASEAPVDSDTGVTDINGVAGLNRVILAEDRGLVIDFWGKWCQPCRALRPHLERLAHNHAAQWRVVAVRVEDNEDLVDAWSVQATPTIVYLRQGEEVHRSTGAVTPSSVAAALEAHA